MNPIKSINQNTAIAATHQVAYFNLVQETLNKEWNSDIGPGHGSVNAKKDDLDAAISLLAQIAFETIVGESIKQSNTKSVQQKAVNETPLSTEDKICAFIKKSAYGFTRECETGFPFSSLHTPAAKGALKIALEGGSIVYEFLIRECFEWMSEEELDKRFGNVFQQLKTSELEDVCLKLKYAYLSNGDNKSGYYLLWLIKRATNASFQIPKIEQFNEFSISEVLSHFILTLEKPIMDPKFSFKIIFGVTFPDFKQPDFATKHNPKFTKNLQFNRLDQCFVYNSLMIGVYQSPIRYKNTEPPHNILAYDMKTEKLIWGSFVPSPILNFKLKQLGRHLSLQYDNDHDVILIDAATGKTHSRLTLPESSTESSEGFYGRPKYGYNHITSEGVCYQLVKKNQDLILFGGKFGNHGEWNPIFKVKAPNHHFKTYESHCGFLSNETLVLFEQHGNQVAIKNCLEAYSKDQKLYLIQSDPTHKDKCLLTVRTLKNDPDVVSPVEITISLDLENAQFGEVCTNGTLIIFSGQSDRSPVFVDFQSKKVTYSAHKFPSYARYKIDTNAGELWTWDEITKKIWKASSSEVVLMGSLNSGRGTALLHVDKDKQLYFVDNPY